MPYIENEVIDRLREIDLLTYLEQNDPGELVRVSDRVYTTREHDSLKISNGKWMWWSRGIGGHNALDYLIKVKNYRFDEAVKMLLGDKALQEIKLDSHRVEIKKELKLPERAPSNDVAVDYLIGRGIDEDIIMDCVARNMIYESMPYHSVVFVGFDENGSPRYAAFRGTGKSKMMKDCFGSNKEYSFRLIGRDKSAVHLFESAIDLLSYATLEKMRGKDYSELCLLSLGGIYLINKNLYTVPKAVTKYLKENEGVKKIYLHFDDDGPGRGAASGIKNRLQELYEVIDVRPGMGKDVNDFLLYMKEIDKKKEVGKV